MSDTFTLTGDADLSAAQSAVDSFVEDAAARDFTIAAKVGEVDTTELQQVLDAEGNVITLPAAVDTVDTSAVDTAVEDIEGESIELKKPTVDAPDRTAFNTGMDSLDSRSDQSRSVLANLSGNAAQDLGEIGGVAGTAGVAIGQLAEYATEGNIALGSLAKVAGPMLALTIGVEVATRAYAAFSNKSKELAENTRELTTAFVESTGGVDAWTSSVAKAVEEGTADPGEAFSATFFEAWDEDKANEVLTALGDIGLSAGDVGEAMVGAATNTEAWATAQFKAAGATDDQAAQLGALFAKYGEYGDVLSIAEGRQGGMIEGLVDQNGELIRLDDNLGAVAKQYEVTGRGLQTLGDASDDADMEKSATDALNAAEGMEEYAGMVAQARDETDSEVEAMQRFQELMVESNATREDAAAAAEAQAKAEAEHAKMLEEAAAGAEAYATAMGGVDWQTAELDGATTAMSTYTDALFDSANQVQAEADAYAKLGAALTDTTLQYDQATEAGFAQSDALQEIAGVIDADLANAFDKADGSMEAFGLRARGIREQVLAKLADDFGIVGEEAEGLVEMLGLTDQDIEARFNLAGAEEARLKLGLLSSAIAGLPADVEREVTLAVTAGDYQAALKIIEDYYAANNPEVITQVTADMEGYTNVVGQAVEDAEGNVTVIPLDAEPSAAEEVVGEVVENAEGDAAVIPLDADPAAANSEIGAVEGGDYQATIDALADTQEAARQLLDETTRQRTATIYALAQITSAKIALDSLKGRRTAVIEAIAHTAGAEAELNHTARSRQSHIYTVTHGGGSSSRAAPAALTAGPTAAAPVYSPTVVINTAVIGDRYDTQRVVTRAIRGSLRLTGARS